MREEKKNNLKCLKIPQHICCGGYLCKERRCQPRQHE